MMIKNYMNISHQIIQPLDRLFYHVRMVSEQLDGYCTTAVPFNLILVNLLIGASVSCLISVISANLVFIPSHYHYHYH